MIPHELIPPTEDFFSRQWIGVYIPPDVYLGIDSTRSKLTELESKLRGRQSLDGHKYNPDIQSFCDRIGWLRSYIGLWTITDRTNDSDVWALYDAQMVYPHTKMVMSKWDEKVLGERREEGLGLLLILLSPSVVDWLNDIDKWVSFPYTVSTTA